MELPKPSMKVGKRKNVDSTKIGTVSNFKGNLIDLRENVYLVSILIKINVHYQNFHQKFLSFRKIKILIKLNFEIHASS